LTEKPGMDINACVIDTKNDKIARGGGGDNAIYYLEMNT